ncbi:hypothetical protein ACMFMG_009480 [Clarireedia jacksonii]
MNIEQRKEQVLPGNTSRRSLRRRIVEPVKAPSVIQQSKQRKRIREEDETSYSAKRARGPAVLVNSPVLPEGVEFQRDYIRHWAKEQTWPRDYFKDDGMNHLLARKGSSLGRKRSNPSLASASDEMSREEKSAPYRNPSYPTFLSDNLTNYKSYIKDHRSGISEASKRLLNILRHTKQSVPRDTLFDDKVFSRYLEKLKGKNESRVIQDLSQLLVPSAEILATFDHTLDPNMEKAIYDLYPNLFPCPEAVATFSANHIDRIAESVNEGWNNCFTITKPRPQPDSSFGYRVSAFEDHQLDKLRPTLGDASFSSFFKATYYMHFPFLTKEVKTGAMGLDIADNQNLHSITIAVRAIVELFKLVGREKELHREILGLTISHDDKSERIYAHYPYIEGDKVTIWRHTVDQFYLDHNSKWRSYIFTKNVYDIFSLVNLRRICSAIDDISPGLNSSRQSETQSSESLRPANNGNASTTVASGLSQQFQGQHLNAESQSETKSNQVTPNTSIQDRPKSPERKKKKRKDDYRESSH